MNTATETAADRAAGAPTESAPSAEPMSLDDAVMARRSVRGFLSKPVPEATIHEILELAQRAPSNCNIQPWRVYVASGAARDRLREGMMGAIRKGQPPASEYDYPAKFDDPYRRHQVECAVAMYGEMGIGRDDKAGRFRALLRNFELFDAPHVLFLGMHESFREPVALDVGIYLQTLMLAMTSRGVACCAQGAMRTYPDVIRAEFGVGPEIRILVGLSFGYEDPAVPANNTRTTRAPLSESVQFKND